MLYNVFEKIGWNRINCSVIASYNINLLTQKKYNQEFNRIWKSYRELQYVYVCAYIIWCFPSSADVWRGYPQKRCTPTHHNLLQPYPLIMKITLARIIFNPLYKVTPVKQPLFPVTSIALLFFSSKLLYHNSGKFLREQHHVQEPHSCSKPEI